MGPVFYHPGTSEHPEELTDRCCNYALAGLSKYLPSLGAGRYYSQLMSACQQRFPDRCVVASRRYTIGSEAVAWPHDIDQHFTASCARPSQNATHISGHREQLAHCRYTRIQQTPSLCATTFVSAGGPHRSTSDQHCHPKAPCRSTRGIATRYQLCSSAMSWRYRR